MCPGDHRPLVFLIRYGDAGRAVTLQLSVPAPEPGEEGGFLYGAGSRCPGPPGPSGLQTLGRGTPDPQQAGGVTRLRRPGGFLGEPVFRPEAGAGKGHSSSHPHCWLNRRAPAWVLGFTKRYAGGGGAQRMEGGAWEGQSARTRAHTRARTQAHTRACGLTLVHARGLTLVHTCDHARTGSCTHVHVLIHTHVPAWGHRHPHTCPHTRSHTRPRPHSPSYTSRRDGPAGEVRQGRGPTAGSARSVLAPMVAPQAVPERRVSPSGGCPAGARVGRHSARQPPRPLCEGAAGVCPQQCPLLSSCINPLRVWILDGFCTLTTSCRLPDKFEHKDQGPSLKSGLAAVSRHPCPLGNLLTYAD